MKDYLDDVIMPFGKYAGEYVCDLPIDYLEWLQDNADIDGDLADAVEASIEYHYSKQGE